MALIIGSKKSRIIQVEAKEPLDNDRVALHKFDVEYGIVPHDIWRSMSERWEELAHRLRTAPDDMTEDEMREAREPIYKIAAAYIKNIGPLLDEDKKPIEFNEEVLGAILSEPWLQQPIADGFMAVQRGLTMADYKKARAKN